MTGAAVAFELERTEDRFEQMLDALTADERHRLDADVKDLLDQEVVDVQALRRLHTSYVMTHALNSHPDFATQRKAYLELVSSGELFEELESIPGPPTD